MANQHAIAASANTTSSRSAWLRTAASSTRDSISPKAFLVTAPSEAIRPGGAGLSLAGPVTFLFAADDHADQQADAGRRRNRAPRVFLDVDISRLGHFLAGLQRALLRFVGLGQRRVERAHAAAAQFLG